MSNETLATWGNIADLLTTGYKPDMQRVEIMKTVSVRFELDSNEQFLKDCFKRFSSENKGGGWYITSPQVESILSQVAYNRMLRKHAKFLRVGYLSKGKTE